MVRTGKVALALAPEKLDDAELTHRALFQDSLVLLCHPDHPLARSRTVTWRQLQPHRLISLKSTSSVRHLVEATYLKQGGVPHLAFEVEYASTVIGFVAKGLGVGVLPRSVMPLVGGGPVIYRPITSPKIERTICVITSKAHSLSPAAEAFVQLCTKLASKHNVWSGPAAR